MSLVHNERVKLLATALNTAGGSSLTVGVLAPVAAAFYNVNAASGVPLPTIVAGAAIWLFRRGGATFGRETRSRGIERMTGTQLFAFVILPLVVAALGWIIALAAERHSHNH
jgi:predicted Na+-dependent transporter